MSMWCVCMFLCVRLWSCMSVCCMYMCVLCVYMCCVCVCVRACMRVYMVSMYALIVCLSKWLYVCVCVCVFRFAVGEQVEVFVDAVKRRLHARYIKVNMISLIVVILEL